MPDELFRAMHSHNSALDSYIVGRVLKVSTQGYGRTEKGGLLCN